MLVAYLKDRLRLDEFKYQKRIILKKIGVCSLNSGLHAAIQTKKYAGPKNRPNDTKDLRARMGGLWGREGVHPGRGPNGNNLAKTKSRSHS